MPSILRGIFRLFNIRVEKLIWFNVLDIITKIILIFIVIKIIIRIGSGLTEKFFERQKKSRFGISGKKADTLSELFKSILRYGLYFVGLFSIFETLWPNVNITIAITSVLGVALGFGSQNLVKDVIAGVFILFEDQFSVGDYVTIDNKSGIVEALGIRTTKIKDFSGDYHIFPNGGILSVTNKTRGDMRALVEVNIAFDENIDTAIASLKAICEQIREDYDTLVEGPEVVGVVGFSELGATVRIVGKTYPMKQFEFECELRKRILKEFQEKDIQIGYHKIVKLNHEQR